MGGIFFGRMWSIIIEIPVKNIFGTIATTHQGGELNGIARTRTVGRKGKINIKLSR